MGIWIRGLVVFAALPLLSGDAYRVRLDKRGQIVHALNRLTWGPRPGDVERVETLGLKRWVDQQLHPDRIRENRELDARLEALETLRMSPREMAAKYPPPAFIVAVAQGRLAPPDDPEVRPIVEALAELYRQRTNAKENASEEVRSQARMKLKEVLNRQQLQILRDGEPQAKAEMIEALPPEQVLTVVASMPKKVRNEMLASAPTELRRKILRCVKPQEVVAADLAEAKVLRAIYSERQLEDVLTDFWFNHFNVFLDKGADRYLITSYERDAIRPHVLGKFRDLLHATAAHPAMLFYLDNWRSAAEGSEHGKRGLNENYARELMELHTLGVDGGYTQKDVTEVARCFTGWTIVQPFRRAEFRFEARLHDNGEKTVLGVRIPAGGGQKDGWKVLDLLASHLSTARFVSRELAQRFVSDDPPESLVNRMAETFRTKDGDLREVMKAMLASPEFWSRGAWRAKMKSPLEMVVSSVRASGASVDSGFVLAYKIGELGQPLYRKVEPTGYLNASAEWVNSASLVGRMNLALELAENRLPGVRMAGTEPAGADAVARSLLFSEPSSQTLAAMEAGKRDAAEGTTPKLVGLVLGSPEFQRR